MPIQFLSANFDWSNLIAGFGGAVIGAYSAFRLSERQHRTKISIENFERIYKAATLAGLTCKEALDLKRQHLSKLSNDYEASRSRVLRTLGTPTVKKVIRERYDLLTIEVNNHLAGELSQKLSTLALFDLKATSYMSSLILNSQNLKILLRERNNWIKSFKAEEKNRTEQTKFALYFGYPTKSDVIDQTYLNIMREVPIACDGMIISSYRLYRLLARASLKAHKNIPKKMRQDFNVSLVDFSFEDYEEFFPNMPELVFESQKTKPKKYVLESYEQYFDAIIDHYLPKR